MQNQKSSRNQTHEFADTVWRILESLTQITWSGTVPLLNKFIQRPLQTAGTFAALYGSLYFFTANALHLRLLAWAWPSLFSGKFLRWLYGFSVGHQRNAVFLMLVFGYVIVLGVIALGQKRRLKEKFESIGLTNTSKRKRKKFSAKIDAKRYEQDLQLKFTAAGPAGFDQTPMAQLMKMHLDKNPNSRILERRIHFLSFCEEFGNRPISKVGKDELSQWFQKISDHKTFLGDGNQAKRGC